MSDADEAWAVIREAFAAYGKRTLPSLRGARRKLLDRLLDDGYSAEDLVAAVHGYVRFHRGLRVEDGFDPRRFFTPESVFRLEKLEPRIELGLDGPWKKPETSNERRDRERQERVAQERRVVAQERSLRAVGGDEEF